jgi:hypothetical protein
LPKSVNCQKNCRILFEEIKFRDLEENEIKQNFEAFQTISNKCHNILYRFNDTARDFQVLSEVLFCCTKIIIIIINYWNTMRLIKFCFHSSRKRIYLRLLILLTTELLNNQWKMWTDMKQCLMCEKFWRNWSNELEKLSIF